MTSIKDFFTININCRLFVPTVTENEMYYELVYKSQHFGTLQFAVSKQTDLRKCKKQIAVDIYEALVRKGIY